MSRGPRRKRRIAVVTGTRADYGLLRSPMSAIRDHPRLTLQVVACGMHLLRKFGTTVKDIERDGFSIDARIPMQRGDDSSIDQAGGLGRGVGKIAAFLDEANTDIVVVLGDRIEAMAGALAAVTTGKVLAHIHGGDAAQGDFDDSLRHAISKLAHVHLTATSDATKRLRRMGEASGRIHQVGAPGIDRIREILADSDPRNSDTTCGTGLQPVAATGSKRVRHGALIVQHASGRSARRERATMRVLLDCVQCAGLSRTIIYPNSDRGHAGVIAAIEAHARRFDRAEVRVVRSLPRDAYLRALIDADVLVGNSSSGIIESSTAGTPAVDIGDRQRGRLKCGPSVIHAEETAESIRQALAVALRTRPRCSRRSVYGDGHAGPRIADVLADLPLDAGLQKKTWA